MQKQTARRKLRSLFLQRFSGKEPGEDIATIQGTMRPPAVEVDAFAKDFLNELVPDGRMFYQVPTPREATIKIDFQNYLQSAFALARGRFFTICRANLLLQYRQATQLDTVQGLIQSGCDVVRGQGAAEVIALKFVTFLFTQKG